MSSKRENQALTFRRIIASSEAIQLGPSSSRLPDRTPMERSYSIFYADDGGFLATDERNRAMNELYYLGIIDILTPYNYVKKVEHAWKSLKSDKVL
jgi:1-phosphatidylinositol-4-phosphate 5-kinase